MKNPNPKKEQAAEVDLAAWATEKGLTFEQFSECIFITAISLGLLTLEGRPVNKRTPDPSFKFSYPDDQGTCELYVRRVKQKNIITPKKSIILKH